MSESPQNGRDGANASVFDGAVSGGESSDPAEEDASLFEEVLRELEEIARHDDPSEKLRLDYPSNSVVYNKIEKVFDAEYGKRFSTERWLDYRMKVMRALGSCLKSCKSVYNMGLGGGMTRLKGLSIQELEAVTRGLEHSTVLKELQWDLTWLGIKEEDVSARWTLVADILRTVENLETLSLTVNSIKDRFVFSQIAEALTYKGVSSLQNLTLSRKRSSWTKGMSTDVSEFLGAARKLNFLRLEGKGMREGGARILGQAMALHEGLKTFHLRLDESSLGRSSAAGAVDCLIKEAFLCSRPNTSIQKLVLGSSGHTHSFPVTERIRLDSLSHLLLRNSSIAELDISMWSGYSSRSLLNLFVALRAHRSIKSFTLWGITADRSVNSTGVGIDSGGFSQLVDWTKSATHLEELFLEFRDADWELNWPAFFKALASNSTLRSLHLYMPAMAMLIQTKEAIEKEMVVWLRTTRLKQLTFVIEPPLWTPLLRSLRANTNLEDLNLNPEVLDDDEAFRELMKLVQVNSTLKDIRFEYEYRLQAARKAQVEEALRCKARQETYLAELRATFGGRGWVHPTCGRVFLCGNPMAGKTQLAHTMLQMEAAWYTHVLEKCLPRTLGIDIQVLKNSKEMQLSLWDLAGQDIFRTLQEYLFPKLNKACVFLFVFSLYDRAAKMRKRKLDDLLEEQLFCWLNFITSNSQTTGFNLPVVMVILTHKDKTQDTSSEWALPVLEKLREEFADVLTIHPLPFLVNGRQKEDVQPILTQVYDDFEDLFEQKLFMVPEECCQVSNFLLGWAFENNKQPVVTYEEFVSLCSAAIPTLKDFLSNHSDQEKKKVIGALASYLHDVGTILEFPQEDLMVVNPNWLTHVFLGNLMSTGKDFQKTPDKKAAPLSDDGFLNQSDFELFVKENVLKPLWKEGYRKLDFKMMLMLMAGLDLCFEMSSGEGRSRFFVPTLFRVERQHSLEWKRHVKGGESYLGLRIRCKDQRRTSLSAGFFPKFQISLWRKMIGLSLDSKMSYDCKYNLISILHDGHDVLVENEEDGNFLDILVRSEKSKGSVWKFVDKHILQELYNFCASAKGPPGVTLVVDVVRTRCVEQLTKCVYRKDQAVSREFLKERLKQSIKDQEKIVGDNSRDLKDRGKRVEDNSGDLFKHTWTTVADTRLTYESEAALDLLSPDDILEVYDWIRSKTAALTDRMTKSNRVLDEFCRTSIGSIVIGGSNRTTSVEKRYNFKQEIPSSSLGQMDSIELKIDGLHEKIDGLHEKIDELKLDFMQMTTQFYKAERTAQDSFTRLFEHMDRLIGISDSSSQLPRRPYFTAKDASWSHRIKAKVNVGDPLVLHFACESENENHVVSQRGFELIVGHENREWLRVILRNSVTALWCLVKAGLHVATSLGSMVPDLELEVSDSKYSSLATLSITSVLEILAPEKISSSNAVYFDSKDNSAAQKAWWYLQDHLRSELIDKIPHFFSLYPSSYTDTKTGKPNAHAWLCKECKETGIAEGRICQTGYLFPSTTP